jgi:L-alanine-DL-glutamate epimerase-like enolase superfamily enzyme
MRIEKLSCELVTMRLQEPYATAQGAYAQARNVIIVVETDSRHVGLGCAAPEPSVTGETAERALALLRGPVAAEIKGREATRWLPILDDLRSDALLSAPAALAAVDMALFDLLGKRADLPLWKLLGGARSAIKTSVTIGVLPVSETVERARSWVAKGFGCLKLKGGLQLEADIERVRQVRAAVGGDVELRFDANQGYDLRQAERFVRAVSACDVSLFEQPTPAAQPGLLAAIRRIAPMPIMADESLLTLRDSFRLAQGMMVDMANVKLMKIGGITSALDVASIARASQLSLMVGCMDESALGIAAALHFALARSSVEAADLDGHIGLHGDPFAGALPLEAGVLSAGPGAGLGVATPW